MKYIIFFLCFLLFTGCNTQKESPVAPVIQEIRFPQDYKVVDLTHVMHPDMAFWPGGVPFEMNRLVDYDSGYRLHDFSMGENTGTHVDAAAHFVEGNHTIEQIPVEDLFVPAVVINIQRQVEKDSDYQLTVEDIEKWEKRYGMIPSDSLVILNTGWYKKFEDPNAYQNMDKEGVMHFPGFGADAAQLLLERKVKGIGIDTLGVDFGASQFFETHQIMLGANKYMIENLANLDVLSATGSTVFVGVLPVQEGTQAQARIVAFVLQ